MRVRQGLLADVVSAQVIGKNTNEFFRVARVTLDRAARDVVPNLPVLSQDGVVGTTLKSSGDTVDVRLIVDAGSGVDVIVQRTGARGFVRGTGDESKYSCQVQYVERTDEVEVAVLALAGRASAVSGVSGDLGDRVALARIAEDVGDVDVLINCAGIYREAMIDAIDEASWRDMIVVSS